MIEVSSNSVSILYPDGTSAVFDAAELSSRIAKSCISAGMPDSWIAEDIALSVEFALQTQLLNSVEKSVHASEIDSCVVSVLEDTGYAEVAEKFLATGRGPGDFGKVSQSDVLDFLSAKLKISPQEVKALAVKVTGAMHAIKAEKCSTRLVMELARHFREAAADHLPVSAPPRMNTLSPSAPEEILVQLPEECRRYVENKVLTLHGVSSLFKSIRLDIDFNPLMKDFELAAPVTELLLAPRLMACAEAADCVCRTTQECCGRKDLPLIITLVNANDFVKRWMLCEEADSVTRCTKNLSDYFCSMLKIKPFKIFSR